MIQELEVRGGLSTSKRDVPLHENSIDVLKHHDRLLRHNTETLREWVVGERGIGKRKHANVVVDMAGKC